jgi:hypothetical protein
LSTALELLAELVALWATEPTLDNLIASYDKARLIRADLEFDSRTTKQERELLDQLDRGISAAIAQARDGHHPMSLHTARVAASALQSSLERRTTGADGWPLRR